MNLLGDYGAIKLAREDFVVHETNSIPLGGEGDFVYAMLVKSGMTTWEAIDSLAIALESPSGKIGYGGLKDEDGVTCQYISVPALQLERLKLLEGERFNAADGSYWQVQICGQGNEPIQIGMLAANAFRVKIRRVPLSILAKFYPRQRIEHAFLNFYGHQRFARPGKEPLAPVIGRAIAENDWELAATLLDPEEFEGVHMLLRAKVEEREFVELIGARARDFFLSSHESMLWNDRFSEMCRDAAERDPGKQDCEALIAAVFSRARSLPYQRHYGARDVGQRSTIVQTQVFVMETRSTDADVGHILLSFLLPSGAYATTCLQQLLKMASPTTTAEALYAWR
jgi:tRNA pseudouridine13 synthase